MNFSELYDIKCVIGRTLFPSQHNWEDRIEMSVDASYSTNSCSSKFVRFKTNQISINICEDNQISVHGLIRKPLKFKHENITQTLFAIQAELVAHLAGEV